MHLTQQQEQFSNCFVAAIAAVAGCAASKPSVDDDSIDWTLSNRLPRRPKLDIQLKCTTNAEDTDPDIRFPLPIKNYRDLTIENLSSPRILVLVLVPAQINDWIDLAPDQLILRRCAFWASLRGLTASDNESTVTVGVPRANRFTVAALTSIMQRINDGELP